MHVKTEVLASFYQDSVILMRIAGQVRTMSGIQQAALFMGTPSNHVLLEQHGLATEEGKKAGPNDLILTVVGHQPSAVDSALEEAQKLLRERRRVVEETGEYRPRTLDAALRLMPQANLAAISVPGAYAKYEALKALRRRLHVFLFSDNVPLEAEIELKREALKRGLFCMGPDQGTAYVNGVGLGFANIVPRGRVGCVAASGTGLQAVAVHLATLGEGISQGIGVGGRDLSLEVGGVMTFAALEALATDPQTEAVVLISKPPHPSVAAKLETVLGNFPKPVLGCCPGAPTQFDPHKVLQTATLDEAAEVAVAFLHQQALRSRYFSDPVAVKARLGRVAADPKAFEASTIVGLFTGGTLAHETRHVLADLLGPSDDAGPYQVIDLGDDRFTVGRPHPMIDSQSRTDFILRAAESSAMGVLLLDFVLGRGAHPNPAQPVVEALRSARSKTNAAGRGLAVVATVVGTPQDPQDSLKQIRLLEAGGVEVLPTNAEAARFAALLVKPELKHRLLEKPE